MQALLFIILIGYSSASFSSEIDFSGMIQEGVQNQRNIASSLPGAKTKPNFKKYSQNSVDIEESQNDFKVKVKKISKKTNKKKKKSIGTSSQDKNSNLRSD